MQRNHENARAGNKRHVHWKSNDQSPHHPNMNGNDIFTPDYTTATGLLQHLNSEELKELLNDDVKLDDMIRDLQQVKNIEAEKEMVMTSNKSIAEYNLSLKPTLEQNRGAVLQLYSRASSLKSEVINKKEKLERKQSQVSLGSVLAILQAKAAEAEELTEVFIKNMINGQVNIDEFVNSFLPARTNVHVLHTKVDKMMAIVQAPAGASVRPMKPVRIRKAPTPPSLPSGQSNINISLPPPPQTGRNPRNPFITSNPFGRPPPPPVPPLPSSVLQKNNSYVIPTRMAPRPPPRKSPPNNSIVEYFETMGVK